VSRVAAIGVLAGLLAVPYAARAASVAGTVTLGDEPGCNAVVYLESGRKTAAAPMGRVVMDQKNLAFVPSVLPVVRGTVIEFTNSDDVQHNVFTPSRVAGKFDLGTYSRGESRKVTLNESGEVVVLCNIHMEMEARILVLDEPTFAATRADGSFEVPAVPPGTYRLRLWRRGWLPHTEIVMVPETGRLSVDVHAER
jgi:plastocyanin